MEDLEELIHTENAEDIEKDVKDEITEEIVEEIPEELKNSLEAIEEAPNETIDIQPENANTTNCLALTIQKEHKLVAVKNVFLRSVRMSWKVVVSTITLALIKLFS